MSRKNDPEFTKLLQEHVTLDEETGTLTFTGLYANLCLNIGWKGNIVVVPYSHVVWLLKHGRWPLEGYHIDHINDCALDNRPANHREVTEAENQAKRRGRMVYRSYGSGKYGYGINVCLDRRDGRYYIRRHLSRGHGNGDLKTIRRNLGGFDTLEQAEAKVKEYIAEIEVRGLDHLPDYADPKQKKSSIRLMLATKRIRKLRQKGLTIEKIAKVTGFSMATIHAKVKDMGVDNRSKHRNRIRPILMEK